MANPEEGSLPDEWLGHAAALRRLAASLLGDENDADDVVQETWLRARSHPSGHRPPWLRTVLRNLVRDRLRERSRRTESERHAARADRVPSATEIGAHLEAAQRLAREVADLDEPYRTAIHLRYFEDRRPEEIAKLCRVPVETARTRLRRGLAKLRERMDASHGGRRELWAVALAPLAARSSVGIGIGVLAMSKKTIGVLVVLGLAAVGLLLYRNAFQRPVDATGARGAVATLEPNVKNAPTPGIAELPPEHREAMTPAVVEPSPAKSADTQEIRGTVVIEDEHGEEHVDESGVLSLGILANGPKPEVLEVPFERGTWSARVPSSGMFGVVKLVARGREALLGKEIGRTPGPDPIAVRGKWLARRQLRVVDAATKQDLKSLEIRTGIHWRSGPQWTHPGDDERMKAIATNVDSPIELPEGHGLEHYWIHAPGHAWARVDIDSTKGGPESIEVSPEPAIVDVGIAEGRAPENGRVRLYPDVLEFEEGGFRFRMPEQPQHNLAAVSVRAPAEGAVRIADLQAGKYVAAVELGEYGETTRLGQARVEVAPGGRASVVVPIDLSPLAVERTHLHGTIELPEGFDRRLCELQLRRVGEGEKPFTQDLQSMSFDGENERRLLWDAGSVRTGDYVARVSWIEYQELVHAPGPEETNLALRIPALTTVSIEVVDFDSGAKLDPERFRWSGPRIEGVPESYYVPALQTGTEGSYRIVSPPGEIRISCKVRGYEEASIKLAVDGPELSHTIRMHRAADPKDR